MICYLLHNNTNTYQLYIFHVNYSYFVHYKKRIIYLFIYILIEDEVSIQKVFDSEDFSTLSEKKISTFITFIY